MPVLVTLNAADAPLPPVNATVLYTTVCAGAVPKTEIVWAHLFVFVSISVVIAPHVSKRRHDVAHEIVLEIDDERC